METKVEKNRKGLRWWFPVVSAGAVVGVLLFMVVLMAGTIVLPRHAMTDPWHWPEHERNLLGMVSWGTKAGRNVYAVFSDGHRFVGRRGMLSIEVLRVPFVLELTSDIYALNYQKTVVARAIYTRSSLLEKFVLSYRDEPSSEEVLAAIAEGERRMALKQRELQEENERYQRIWFTGS